ncbi:cytochrome P450 [Dictyobacter alpinus]|uniref:Cytochrome P450 n=1 Tax=Dictyobacter alpinus TaxID=2014873 RepID=A0A402BFQ6_9CHLR|nr:cytochrome P450 [Dictyobacter alpinus]GCE30176.1 cytochrome P450 [Dictyobacter alpinus]
MQSFFGPDFIRNPYPIYDVIRQHGPVYKGPDGRWLVTGYNEANTILRARHFGVKHVWSAEDLQQLKDSAFAITEALMFLHLDPPDHTRLRALVSKAFTPKRVAELQPAILQIVQQLLDDIQAKHRLSERSFDFIQEFAFPLPIIVIAELLGVPVEDRGQFRQWSRDIVRVENAVRFAPSVDQIPPESLAEANQVAHDMRSYFRHLASLRREQPQDDLISAMVKAEESAGTLSEDEFLSACIIMIVAGHETTMNLLGNGIFALLNTPEQLALLKEHPEITASAIEEFLRFNSPVQMTLRVAKSATTLGTADIHVGDELIILLGAANHDPERFPQPDQLNIQRDNIQPLSFGAGMHYCIGAPLARLEGQLAFPELLKQLPDLAFAAGVVPDELAWNENFALHGLKTLPLQFS